MPLDFKQERSPEAAEARLVHGYDIGLPSDVYVHHVPLGTASIVEGIDDDLTSFRATLIHAPTGFGKTHFVLHEVLPKVLQDGGRMLLVSNRVAVSYQQKLEVMKLTDPSEVHCLTPEGILKKTDFGPVKIMTLQALDLFLASTEGRAYAKEVSVLVVDEVHYFTSDVSFNPNTARLLKTIPQLFCRAVRIYMTATPDDVLRPLADAEAKVRRPIAERTGIQFSPLMLGQTPGVNLYQFSTDKYSHLPVRYYRADNELYQEIRNRNKDKWLIFVPSKELGVCMQKELGDDAMFISAASKGSSVWNQLLSEERSPCRVLIATSVLDCGVNLCDDSIRHVVIPFEDPTVFMQALGRARWKGEPRFTLYVKALSAKRLNGLIHQNYELLALAEEIRAHKCCNSYVDRFRQERDCAKNSLLYLGYNNSYEFNTLYYHKLRRQKQYYQQLAEAIDQYGDAAFPRLVHQWLGQTDAYDDRNWLSYSTTERRQGLLIYLASCNGRCLNSETEKKSFSETLHQFYQDITGNKKRDDRGDGYLKTSALNSCLKELKIDGRVTSNGRKGGWIFKMAEDGGKEEPAEEGSKS